MLSMFKFEFKRAITSKRLFFALMIGVGITLWHLFQNVLPMHKFLAFGASEGMLPHSVFSKWIGGESHNLQPTLYYILFPILAALPYADTFYTDIQSGYVKQIFTRSKKTNYYFAKYLVNFIVSGTVVVIPLLINLLGSAVILPSIIPQVSSGFYGIGPESLWSELFYTNPYLYIYFYLFIDFIFAGLLSSIALMLASYLSNKFLVIFSPFIIYILVYTFTNVLGAHTINPNNFLKMNQPVAGISLITIISFALILLISTFGLYYKGKKDDVF